MSEYKTVEEDELKSLPPKLTPKELGKVRKDEEITCVEAVKVCISMCIYMSIYLIPMFMLYMYSIAANDQTRHVPEIKIISMDFVAEFNDKNNTTTQQQSHYLPDLVSARWDLLIRVPGKLVGDYMCLQGNLQASFLYKNVTLFTSSIQSYNKLELRTPQLLNVSAIASKGDLSGAIRKEIMDAIKERSEVRFGSRLSLTDCREETKKGTMSYECEEAKLRIKPGSDQIKATAFGNHPTCIIYF